MVGYALVDDSVLMTFDLESFEAAEAEVDPSVVTCVRVGAKLYKALKGDLIPRLQHYPNLRTVVLSDDWIEDKDMPLVRSSFELAFPNLIFAWKAEGLVAGKHGR
jgi:hypothetical protein